jgi:hypothetical protein
MFNSVIYLVKLTYQQQGQYSHKDFFSFSNLLKSSNCLLKVTPV